jgi:16S rRNA (guanine1516-N2)-methyltransferase
MRLVHAESREWLSLQGAAFDVIYLDPMFPERRKSALVKKEMRIFQDILGTDEDAATLLEQARAHCRSRVVVKRPSKAPVLGDSKPSYCVSGKSTRFDVYLAVSQHRDER